MKSLYAIITLLMFFVIASSNQAFADEKITLHYDKPQKVSASRTTYYDLSQISLQITDVQVLPMDDTPGYAVDDADLVKITIVVTNNGSGNFVVLDKMFDLWIMGPSKKNHKDLDVIDNYETTYDDQLEVIYEKMNSRELFNECDQTIEGIENGKSISFTLCYDILKSRSKGVDLDGPKKYLLVMMDNQQSTSCPNCKKITLESNTQTMPSWTSKLLEWKKRNLISEHEVNTAINHLKKNNLLYKESHNLLTLKNKEFARYQKILSEAYSKNLFVSTIQMIESKPQDSFTGMFCKKQNNVITLDADYTNNNKTYDVIFFRLTVFDDSGAAIEGMSKIVNVAPKSFRHLSTSVPSVNNPMYCAIEVDFKFP